MEGIRYKTVAQIMRRNGWTEMPQKSTAHVIWKNGSLRMSIPKHSNGVNRMVLRRLFRDYGIDGSK